MIAELLLELRQYYPELEDGDLLIAALEEILLYHRRDYYGKAPETFSGDWRLALWSFQRIDTPWMGWGPPSVYVSQ